MVSGEKRRLFYYAYVIVLVLVAIFLFASSLQDIIIGDKYQLIFLFLLCLYCQFNVIPLDESSSSYQSLSSAVVFPILFLQGVGLAMVVFVLVALISGLARKQKLNELAFNASQITIITWISGQLYQKFGGTFGSSIHLDDFPRMLLALISFVVINISLVKIKRNLVYQISWKEFTELIRLPVLVNYFMISFIGIVYTLFVVAWGNWGALIFACLIIGMRELLSFGGKLAIERRKREKAEEELLIDPKTQVYNFRFLTNWLNDRSKIKTALLFIDIDDFKNFNDYFGHEKGDEVLKLVAKEITNSVRKEDKVIRFGGEEFIVILPRLNSEQACLIARRIQENIAKLSITVSIGISCYPETANDKHELLRLADIAMYRAKTSGKNQVVCSPV
ncbi:MAG: GGDEF domain-containing protein [Firmicutes bacterium]|nr:GGDEF domain-containing protein [Bacillota bacterium]